MSERLRQFWQARYAKHGHTGWSDSAIYAYDQLERLAIVRGEVERLVPSPRTALDYGCGSGDFSRLLLHVGLRVWGFDPFVRPEIQDVGFTYAPTLPAFAEIPMELDLMVCVTVLDHILDETELLDVLSLLRSKIAPGGTFLLIEYAFDAEVTRRASDYQALRRLEDWRRLLSTVGWAISSVRPVPTVPESPSAGFLEFRGSPWVNQLGKIANRRGVGGRIAREFLHRRALRVFERRGTGAVAHSPLKLIHCTPRDAGRAETDA